jgi:hypothetical protein
MNGCEICGAKIEEAERFCERCKMSLFQILEILKSYVEEDPPPNWLIKGVRELSWIFREYPRTQGYFNTAMEILELFIIDRLDEIEIKDIDELNQTSLPRDKVLTLLKKSFIIKIKGRTIFPGALTKKLQRVRWEGYQMDTPQIENKLLEVHGVLTAALSRSLIVTGEYFPRRALAIFHLFSEQMINSGRDINPVIPEHVFLSAFRNINKRQRARISRIMSGFLDGHTKVISDAEEDGSATLKEVMTIYCQKMRERYRERERQRTR